MYQVIGTGKSRALRVLWMLEELGQPYQHVPVNAHSEGVTSFNPAGKVPVLVVDSTPITDSTAILTYLADHHGARGIAPGRRDRQRQHDAADHLGAGRTGGARLAGSARGKRVGTLQGAQGEEGVCQHFADDLRRRFRFLRHGAVYGLPGSVG